MEQRGLVKKTARALRQRLHNTHTHTLRHTCLPDCSCSGAQTGILLFALSESILDAGPKVFPRRVNSSEVCPSN